MKISLDRIISPNIGISQTNSGTEYLRCNATKYIIDPNNGFPLSYRTPKALDWNGLVKSQKQAATRKLVSSGVAYQPKVDGIRCTILNAQPISASGRVLPNRALQKLVSTGLYDGLDGELLHESGSFRSTQSQVMSIHGGLDGLKFHVFDLLDGMKEFYHRWDTFVQYHSTGVWNQDIVKVVDTNIIPAKGLSEARLNNLIKDLEEHYSYIGEEGFVLRQLDAYTHFGRSNLTSPTIVKFKIVQDAEAIVLEVNQGKTNLNETVDELGGTQSRKFKQENFVPTDLAGSLKVVGVDYTPFANQIFNVSLGSLSEDERRQLLKDSSKLIDQKITFKYFGFGDYNLPRSPIFKSFRNFGE